MALTPSGFMTIIQNTDGEIFFHHLEYLDI